MIVRVAVLALFALVPWIGEAGSAADSRMALPVEMMPSPCGEQSAPLDEPSVDTDPGRPITEEAALPADDDGGDQGDLDGACRSESLEFWFQQEPPTFIEAMNATPKARS